MLLKRLKSNNLVNLFLIPLAILAFWAGNFIDPYIYPHASGEADNVLFAPIFRLTNKSPLLSVVLSAVLTLALAFLIDLLISRYQFIRIRTRLPAILFVVLLGGFTGVHSLHPVYFASVFLLLALFRLFVIFDQPKAYSGIFDVGILLGTGALFYLHLVFLLPAFLIGVMVLSRGTQWRSYFVLLIGFLLPFIFALSYFFYTDRFQELISLFIQSMTTTINHLKNNLPLQVYLGALVFFTIISSIDIAQHYDSKKVSSRKYFTVLFLVFIFTLATFILVPATSQEMLVITTIPVTFLLSNFFVFLKRKFFGELLFALLIVFVIILQFWK